MISSLDVLKNANMYFPLNSDLQFTLNKVLEKPKGHFAYQCNKGATPFKLMHGKLLSAVSTQ